MQVMYKLSEKLNRTEDMQTYRALNEKLSSNANLERLHWSEEKQMFADFGLHTDHVRLSKGDPTAPGQKQPARAPGAPSHQSAQSDLVRVTLKEPKHSFVASFGYVSLFPLMFHLLTPNNPKLGRVLQDLNSTSLLWTDYGLRSLAKNSPFYGKANSEKDAPYWRGAVWVNINYLTLCALRFYAGTELAINEGNSETPHVTGPQSKQAAELYTALRKNLVKNMYSEWKRTGYVWESYRDTTGEGKGSRPFTGWSSLVVLAMAEIC